MSTPARVSNAQETDFISPQTSEAPDRKPDGQECTCSAAGGAHIHEGDDLTKLYRYQPKDKEGRPLGGAQVIKYKTEQELADKMAEQNSELIRMNRELKWQSDKPTEGDVPADAERLQPKLRPRPLEQAERVKLSQELLDPEKMDSAAVRLFEAVFGVKPETIQQLNDNMAALRAAEEGRLWVQGNQDFREHYAFPENVHKLHKWCADRKLAPVQKNFDLAFRKLKEAGLLLEAPIAAEETRGNTHPEAETTESRIAPAEVTPPPTRTTSTSSGLTRSQTSGGGGAPAKRGLTWADVDRMPQAEFEKKLRTDANFRKAIDALPPR